MGKRRQAKAERKAEKKAAKAARCRKRESRKSVPTKETVPASATLDPVDGSPESPPVPVEEPTQPMLPSEPETEGRKRGKKKFVVLVLAAIGAAVAAALRKKP